MNLNPVERLYDSCKRVAAMSSAMPSSIPSFQQVSLNPTESIVPDATIRSEQVTSAMIDHPEQMVSDNQMGM